MTEFMQELEPASNGATGSNGAGDVSAGQRIAGYLFNRYTALVAATAGLTLLAASKYNSPSESAIPSQGETPYSALDQTANSASASEDITQLFMDAQASGQDPKLTQLLQDFGNAKDNNGNPLQFRATTYNGVNVVLERDGNTILATAYTDSDGDGLADGKMDVLKSYRVSVGRLGYDEDAKSTWVGPEFDVRGPQRNKPTAPEEDSISVLPLRRAKK